MQMYILHIFFFFFFHFRRMDAKDPNSRANLKRESPSDFRRTDQTTRRIETRESKYFVQKEGRVLYQLNTKCSNTEVKTI